MKKPAQWHVGLLLILSLAILLGTLLVTGSVQFFSGQRLMIDYGFAGPIKIGASVRISGVVVGRVEDVEFLGGLAPDADPDIMVRVHCRIEERARHLMTDKARYYVTTLGVLGEHYVDIEPGSNGQKLEDGAIVRGIDLARSDLLLPRAAGFMELLRDLLDEGRPEINALLSRVSDVLSRLDQLLASEDTKPVLDQMGDIISDSRSVLTAFQRIIGDGRQLKASLDQGQRMMKNGEALLRDLNEMDLSGLSAQGRTTLSNADKTMEILNKRMAEAEGTLLLNGARQAELAKTFETTFWELEKVSVEAIILLNQLENGQGAMGKAFQDEQLIEDLKAVLRQIRTNPAGMLWSNPFKSGPKPQSEPKK